MYKAAVKRACYRYRNRGRVSPGLLAAVISIVVISLLLLTLREGSVEHTNEISVHCAAGLRAAVEPLANQYEREFGVKVNLDYGPSGKLLNSIDLQPHGDLYIPADDSFVAELGRRGHAAEALSLARFRLCIAVSPGNPKNIKSVGDLLREDVRLSMAHDTAAAGKMVKEMLEPSGQFTAVRAAAKVLKPTVTEVAMDLKTQSVDAALIWDATAAQRGLEVVRVPEFEDAWGTITATVLNVSTQPADALRFARYLAAPTKGGVAWAKEGYDPIDGDPWAVTPEITIYSGGVNRPAIEQTVKAFEQREGVKLNVVYNGCGALVAQMKAGAWPDAYFTCDASFSEQVTDAFEPFTDVSRMKMVILVKPGNPLGLRSLADLKKEGVKVGRAHEELSALGALTMRLLKDVGEYEGVKANTAAVSPSAAELVPQVIGHLDAAIVYIANAHAEVEKGNLEMVPIDYPMATATQNFGVLKEAKYPSTTKRFFDAIHSAGARADFERVGFELTGGAPGE